MTASIVTAMVMENDGRRSPECQVAAPGGVASLLEAPPPGATVTTSLRRDRDVVLGFAETLSAATASLADGGVLWICYPKLTSEKAGELSRDLLGKELGKLGLRAETRGAPDETWSGMRFISEG